MLPFYSLVGVDQIKVFNFYERITISIGTVNLEKSTAYFDMVRQAHNESSAQVAVNRPYQLK
jgi:hypothetical protein